MSMVCKSISVTGQQDEWIKTQIAKGFFGNDSEVIRSLIREHQVKERDVSSEMEMLRRKLEIAEKIARIDDRGGVTVKDVIDNLGLDDMLEGG